MHGPTYFPGFLFSQNLQNFFVSLPVMDYNGQPQLSGHIELFMQTGDLYWLRFIVAVEVEADLAVSYHLRFTAQGQQFLEILGREGAGIVGMDAYGGVDLSVGFSQSNGPPGGGKVDAYGNDLLNTHLPCSCQDILLLGNQVLEVQMAMGVNKHV